MIHLILGVSIEVVIQTVFLTAALWIMVKIQKLDYNFLGLLGAAALTNVLSEGLILGLGYFLGDILAGYIARPIVVVVLLICIAKITQANGIDVVFTVAISYPLLLCMNLFLLGAMLGDLRPDLHPVADSTNAVPGQVAAGAPAGPAKQPTGSAMVNPAAAAAKNFSVKSFIPNGASSMLVLDTGTKLYTLAMGEDSDVQAPDGSHKVRFDQFDTNSVTLLVDGQPAKLPLR